jgi:hypothetical protein
MYKSQFARPCVVCGKLSKNGSYCEVCDQPRQEAEKQRQSARKRNRPQYSGDYKRRAKIVRDSAVICHLCNEGARPNDPWHADHLIPGDINSPLAPAHKSCNESRGNKPLKS